jgi:hypothetical protein
VVLRVDMEWATIKVIKAARVDMVLKVDMVLRVE